MNEQTEWNDALINIPHTVYHSWAYCSALRHSLSSDIRLFIAKDEHIGHALVFTYATRSKGGTLMDVYSPYGFGGVFTNAPKKELDKLQEAVRERFVKEGVVTAFLMGHPLLDPNLRGFEGQRSAYVMKVKNVEYVWRGMRANYRNEISKLEKEGNHSILFDKERLAPELSKLYFQTLERVGASNTYYFNKRTLEALIENEFCTLVGAETNGEVLAVIMILENPYCAEYFINASLPDGRVFTKQLLWEAIKKLNNLGSESFNLGGGAQEGDFLESFKRRFGGEKRLIPLWKDILMPDRYQELCQTYHTDPSSTDYFPAYWKK